MAASGACRALAPRPRVESGRASEGGTVPWAPPGRRRQWGVCSTRVPRQAGRRAPLGAGHTVLRAEGEETGPGLERECARASLPHLRADGPVLRTRRHTEDLTTSSRK